MGGQVVGVKAEEFLQHFGTVAAGLVNKLPEFALRNYTGLAEVFVVHTQQFGGILHALQRQPLLALQLVVAAVVLPNFNLLKLIGFAAALGSAGKAVNMPGAATRPKLKIDIELLALKVEHIVVAVVAAAVKALGIVIEGKHDGLQNRTFTATHLPKNTEQAGGCKLLKINCLPLAVRV